MAAVAEKKITCQTPSPGKQPIRIDQWKYDLVRSALLKLVPKKGDGVGMGSSGSPDMLLGAAEIRFRVIAPSCPTGPYQFQPGRLDHECDVFHFWSLHPGGANFAMCDGSVHFLSYSADKILPALATRAGNEAVELP